MDIKQMISELFTESSSTNGRLLLLASTIEPVVTGLLERLEHAYFQHTGITVRHTGVGSGQAMSLAIMGRVDMIITHSPEMEDDFIHAGYGLQRMPIMSNEFLIVGARENTANLNFTGETVESALKTIAEKQAPFISRGDRSGTHFRELRLWEWTGVNPFGKQWYNSEPKISGNEEVMKLAVECSGYALVDRASYLSSNGSTHLQVFVKKDALLTNTYVAIPVNGSMVPINQWEAARFADWLTGCEAAAIIDSFGRQRYGIPLFTSFA